MQHSLRYSTSGALTSVTYVWNFYSQNGDSPACILSFILTAWRRGELSEAWQWNDGAAAASQSGSVDDKAANDSAGGEKPEPEDAVEDTVGSQ
jgi:hypothetical protein